MKVILSLFLSLLCGFLPAQTKVESDSLFVKGYYISLFLKSEIQDRFANEKLRNTGESHKIANTHSIERYFVTSEVDGKIFDDFSMEKCKYPKDWKNKENIFYTLYDVDFQRLYKWTCGREIDYNNVISIYDNVIQNVYYANNNNDENLYVIKHIEGYALKCEIPNTENIRNGIFGLDPNQIEKGLNSFTVYFLYKVVSVCQMDSYAGFSKWTKNDTCPDKSVNIAPIVGGLLAGMTSPVTNTGETSRLADNLGATASQSTALSNLPEKNNKKDLIQPKSGINFVLYNSRFDVVDENTGYMPVDDNINAIQNLSTDLMIMKEAGYVEIFVNNDAQTPVYYDNIRVSHSGGNVLEVNAYYPYGMIIPGLSMQAAPSERNFYTWSAKELQEELGLHWYDHGMRMYDPFTRMGWMVPDPLAEKYYWISPYAYCLNNPIRFIDPDGKDVYMLFYTLDDKLFKAAAETRMKEIQSAKGFDPEKDKVIMMGVSDLGQIGDLANWAVSTYSEQFGETAEVGMWSHAGWDGPIGDVPTSRDYALHGYQMSLDGWNDINFNWKNEGSNMSFYGCNTGNDILGDHWVGSFAKNVSNLDNFGGVNVWGQQTTSYPSFSPYYRTTNMARSIGYGYVVGDTYMVGGNRGQGTQSHWFMKGVYPRANPMNVYQNGRFTRSAYQNR